MRTLANVAAAAAFALVAGAGAQAATLYTSGPTVAMETPGSVSASFAALAGPGSLSLQVQGYATLDGDNDWIDILHIRLNGSEIFSGTWDLGGGGIDRNDAPTFVTNAGATVVKNASAHTLDITLPLALASGSNSLVVSYESPSTFGGTTRAGFQGLGDEGWGLNSLTVTGTVPEPAAALLFLSGLGLVAGLAAKRRRG